MIGLSIVAIFLAIVSFGLSIVLIVMYYNKNKVFNKLIEAHNTNTSIINSLNKALGDTNADVKKLADLLSSLSELVKALTQRPKSVTNNKKSKISDN